MALALETALQNAQDGNIHKPIISLVSGKITADLPLKGTAITHDANQDSSHPVLLSDGRFAIVYAGRGYYGDRKAVRIIISDENQETFGNYITINDMPYHVVDYIDAIVLNDSDNIGVGVFYRRSTEVGLYYYKVNSSGVKLSDVKAHSSNTVGNITGISLVKRGESDFATVWTEKPDGTNYSFYAMTSTDFVAWSVPVVLSIGGLDSTKVIRDPKIIKLFDGTYFMVFSYQSLVADTGSVYNIYYTTSNDFINWTDAVAITTTEEITKDYVHPDVVQKSDNSIFVTTGELNTYLQITKASMPTSVDDLAVGPSHFSEATGQVYFTSGGSAFTRAIAIAVDMDTFSITKYYDRNTSPAIPANWADSSAPGYKWVERGKGDAHYCVLYNASGVVLVDTLTDTIRPYYFFDKSSTYGAEAAKNVDWSVNSPRQFSEVVHGVQVDAANNRIYVILVDDYLYTQYIRYGYLELNQTTPPYTWHDIGNYTNYGYGHEDVADNFKFYPDDGMWLSVSGVGLDSDTFSLWVWSLTENVVLKRYSRLRYPEFPHKGFFDIEYAGGKIWALVRYSTRFASDSYKKGLAEIDLDTDEIFYHECPWVDGTLNYIQRMSYCAETNELILHYGDNIITLNIETMVWTDYDYTGILTYLLYAAIYNPLRRVFFLPQQTGSGAHTSGRWLMLPRDGTLNIVRYLTANFTTDWNFSDINTMLYGYSNVQTALDIGAEDSIYATWTDESASEDYVKWDKTGAELNLNDYLIGEIELQRSIDGATNKLTFSLSNGHLFDPANTNSILNTAIVKGNKIVLKFGELVDGIEYFTDQGSFIISELKTDYVWNKYPIVRVICEDRRIFWEQNTVIAATVSEELPDNAIKQIILNETKMVEDDFNLTPFIGGFNFDAQWLDTPLKEIVDQISNRFKYFITMDVMDKVVARPISITGAVNHTYTNKDQFSEFSPDDSFSDFTNKIIVKGQSLNDIEVLYAEERLASLSGTVGWWGFNKDYDVYYSEDKSKRAKYPRLVVIETATSIAFSLAGKVKEKISEEDTLEHQYCVVEVKAPNLTAALIAAIAGHIAATFIPDKVVSVFAGVTVPWGRVIEGVFMLIIANILGSIGNFKYEIWGKPVGFVKREVSGYAEDLEMQQKIGEIILQEIEGFLCDTALRCKDVAEFEMMITKAQRNRATVKKTAHLQDLEGDTITFPHPYTGNTVKMYITNLTRKYRPSDDSGNGYFTDEIEGWVL